MCNSISMTNFEGTKTKTEPVTTEREWLYDDGYRPEEPAREVGPTVPGTDLVPYVNHTYYGDIDPVRYETERVWHVINDAKFFGTREEADRVRFRGEFNPEFNPEEDKAEVLEFARFVSEQLEAMEVPPTFDIVSTSNTRDDLIGATKLFRKAVLGKHKPPIEFSEEPLDSGWLVSATTLDNPFDEEAAHYHAIDGQITGIYLSATGKGLMKFVGTRDGLARTKDLSQSGFSETDGEGPNGDRHITLRAQHLTVEPLTEKDKFYERTLGTNVGKVALHMNYNQDSISQFLVDLARANGIIIEDI